MVGKEWQIGSWEWHGSRETQRRPWFPSAPLTPLTLPLSTGIICLISIYGIHYNPRVWPDSKVSSCPIPPFSQLLPFQKGQSLVSKVSPPLYPRKPDGRAGCRA